MKQQEGEKKRLRVRDLSKEKQTFGHNIDRLKGHSSSYRREASKLSVLTKRKLSSSLAYTQTR